MKYLYYNPYELPTKIKICSSCFNLDTEYFSDEIDGKPIYFDELFKIAALDFFDDVQVLLTSHNGAYIKDSKKALVGTTISGWISLKEYRNGGGWLSDKYCMKVNNPDN